MALFSNAYYQDKEESGSRCSSCDTFVILPPNTSNDCIIFGKNSDRPYDEVQEVVHIPSQDYSLGTKLRCTYIEIDQAEHTYAVILSKPAWMWGAEMGANEHGLCIGNEAVWTAVDIAHEKALLGMDLLRLGLERCTTAREALHVITKLLERYGQGGQCAENTSLEYHNSFIIADRKEAWILETAGKLWAAEHVKSGSRNISNSLSIHTKIDLMSENLKEYARKNKLWHPLAEFDFALIFGDGTGDDPRFRSGRQLLAQYSASKDFTERHMIKILRDTASGICMHSGSFITTASQVSVLPPLTSDAPCYHFFTATPNPLKSMFKPFVFTPNIQFTEKTVSPIYEAPIGPKTSGIEANPGLHSGSPKKRGRPFKSKGKEKQENLQSGKKTLEEFFEGVERSTQNTIPSSVVPSTSNQGLLDTRGVLLEEISDSTDEKYKFEMYAAIKAIRKLFKTSNATLADHKWSLSEHVDRSHHLYKIHERVYPKLIEKRELQEKLRKLEDQHIDKIIKLKDNTEISKEAEDLFTDAVNAEIELYETM